MDNLLLNEYIIKIKNFINLDGLENFHVLIILGIIFLGLVLLVVYFYLFNNESSDFKKNSTHSKPSLNEIINEDNSNANLDNNDFIDVLVAIEEEMAAIRELYVGGYITKGIYISETDRLYEKAKEFGL